jgi:diguanylate cyclase (GGDEF)-like protein
VTERDIVGQAIIFSKALDETTVAEIMTKQVVSCFPGTATSEAREIMTTNKIRHLPIVDNGVVVGMLSARDVMGQQLLEDRAAAEEVTMLSNCLKSIDLDEVANIVASEVPKLFQAQRSVLCFHEYGCTTKNPVLVSSKECLCPREHLKRPEDVGELSDKSGFYCDSMPHSCEKLGAQSPRLVIGLSVRGPKESSSGKSRPLSAYLCMCGLATSVAANRELTSYKAKLVREILNSHLTNARLYQEARLTSLTDALTGIGSRRFLEDRLEAECARTRRYRRPFSVAIIDLDNFKTINDVLGHASGDDVLKKLAACMKSQKREADALARYGGDEFVILMPETKAQDALTLLERLRARVQEIKLAQDVSITISCGIAQSRLRRPDSSSETMRRADMALYEAKSAGRNCVKIWDETMSKLVKAGDIEVEKIKKLQRRIAGLSEQAEKMFIQSIWGLVQALEAKDSYAKKHSENVMYYSLGIAEMMKIAPKQIETIGRAAMIHDIGKIGIPDAILSKPGKLTPRERTVIEQHPLIAVRILENMTFLEREIAIVRHHHEKWNGLGYPDGLSKTSIPLGARIMVVADTFDGLTSDRSYHNSRCLAEAMEILVDSSGYEFDPEVVNAMVCWVEKVRSELDGADQLTPEDLLDSQKHLDSSSIAGFPPCGDPPPVCGVAASSSIT